MRDYKKELKEDLTYGRKNGFKVVLVEANPDKGFNYSYFVYIPNTPQNTIMMDCLNDYEDEMPEGHTENLEGLEATHIRNVSDVFDLPGEKYWKKDSPILSSLTLPRGLQPTRAKSFRSDSESLFLLILNRILMFSPSSNSFRLLLQDGSDIFLQLTITEMHLRSAPIRWQNISRMS